MVNKRRRREMDVYPLYEFVLGFLGNFRKQTHDTVTLFINTYNNP